MSAYYNENNREAAAWLRELIRARALAPGVVDERDIRDVTPSDLAGYTQCHFFAGVGVWSYALRLAGWSDDRPVWTGSCPCQPFSQAGGSLGFADERHLWPAWFHLIEECRPVVIFGEQVASPDALVWIDLVSTDMEGAGYAVGTNDLCAASVGAPHVRQRLWFMGNTHSARSQGRIVSGDCTHQLPVGSSGMVNGFWDDAEWVYCADGKYRPIEPGTLPLAYGAAARVGRLRGYGNAIVAEVAATFIECCMGELAS